MTRLSFVPLDGPTPSNLELDALPPTATILALLRSALGPYATADFSVETVAGNARPDAPEAGIHLIYVYGHAWMTADGPKTSASSADSAVVEDGASLLERLITPSAPDRTVLVLDCCHAAAFDGFLGSLPRVPRLVIYACAADEKAIALIGDRATRLSLRLAKRLQTRANSVDLARVVAEVADDLSRDGVVQGQSVTYRMNGPSIRLGRGPVMAARSRERTVARVRNAWLAAGAVLALLLVGGGWFYRGHALVDVDASGLTAIAAHIRISASEEAPVVNGSRIFADVGVAGGRVRLWVPASDVILRLQADYADGKRRGLAFHLTLAPGIDPTGKSLHLKLPAASEVLAHPEMAYVPSSAWFHGRDLERHAPLKPFWIDLEPPTSEAYLPVAGSLVRSGRVAEADSFMMRAQLRSDAVDAVGAGQLRGLSHDLGKIFGAIDAAQSQHVSAPGEVASGLGEKPCPTCPALMTHVEARAWCASRGMRLPTNLEWELAVRGVDGRVYPWGDRFDGTRANVPGLPVKGAAPSALKPVEAYPEQRSPFGLVDTVGNAGDWVENATGSYEFVYMGATFRFNPEDATAFQMLPVTDEDSMIREVTARCVAE